MTCILLVSTVNGAWEAGVPVICEGATKGINVDKNDNGRCFTYCYGQPVKVKGIETSGYRSCCGVGNCFQPPDEIYPYGQCSTCDSNG